jgi:hypothetical protein
MKPTDKYKLSKLAVFTFGRFNPPTRGHDLLVTKVRDIAKAKGGTPFVFPSVTVDVPSKLTGKLDPSKSRNPLTWDIKIKHIQQLFQCGDIVVRESDIISPHDVIPYLHQQGFTSVIFVVGADRVEEFTRRWLPYAARVFTSAQIKNIGIRDPNRKGVVGMSASNAREAARHNNCDEFTSATGWAGDDAYQLFSNVRRGMGLDI